MAKHRIFVAGHKGMVGSAITRLLKNQDVEIIAKDRSELDLLNQQDVQDFFKNEKIDQVYLAAAKVGGIHANNIYPADFIYENLMVQTNVIHSAFVNGVKKLLFLGSSCIYPKYANQPMKEEELLAGKLEPTNEPYAIAKIAGIKMCESYNRQYGKSHGIDYRSIMPTNLYGSNDNFDLHTSHVLPAMIRKFHEAKLNGHTPVTLWGSGTPKREFTYVNDFADWIFDSSLFLEKLPFILNTGIGQDYSVMDYYKKVLTTLNLDIRVTSNLKMPNGNYRKLMDSTLARNFGWDPKINIDEGIKSTIKWYLENRIAN